jgi:hypothetical protein
VGRVGAGVSAGEIRRPGQRRRGIGASIADDEFLVEDLRVQTRIRE